MFCSDLSMVHAFCVCLSMLHDTAANATWGRYTSALLVQARQRKGVGGGEARTRAEHPESRVGRGVGEAEETGFGGWVEEAHDKTCVRDGRELGRRWWAENARVGTAGRAEPRRALRRNRTLRTVRTVRTFARATAKLPTTTRDPHHPCPKQSENFDRL